AWPAQGRSYPLGADRGLVLRHWLGLVVRHRPRLAVRHWLGLLLRLELNGEGRGCLLEGAARPAVQLIDGLHDRVHVLFDLAQALFELAAVIAPLRLELTGLDSQLGAPIGLGDRPLQVPCLTRSIAQLSDDVPQLRPHGSQLLKGHVEIRHPEPLPSVSHRSRSGDATQQVSPAARPWPVDPVHLSHSIDGARNFAMGTSAQHAPAPSPTWSPDLIPAIRCDHPHTYVQRLQFILAGYSPGGYCAMWPCRIASGSSRRG